MTEIKKERIEGKRERERERGGGEIEGGKAESQNTMHRIKTSPEKRRRTIRNFPK